MICDSERMSADHFELSFRDQQISHMEMTADACGITQDSYITVLENPINPVSFHFPSLECFQTLFSVFLLPMQTLVFVDCLLFLNF